MPKLLQLNCTANWGSTGKIAEGIGLAAMKHGWESVIAYGRAMNTSQSHLVRVGSKTDVYLHYAGHRFFDREGLGSKRATKRLLKCIDNYKPDIIHLHNIHDHWLNYPLFFRYLATIDTPVVWTLHDCWAFTGGCAYFDKVDCRQWESECRKCPLKSHVDRSRRNFNLKKEFIAPLHKRLIIVPVSFWLERFVRNSFLKDCCIEMIHNGIDTERFKPTSSKKNVVLGIALPWSARKGLDDMIILRELLSDDVEIRLVGLNDEQLKNLPKGITGIKRTQSIKELVRHYSEASILVNPTYEDNFPTTNLEALACGTPVVTYRTGGSPEAIDAQTGIVVPKGDIEDLAKAIKEGLDNPKRFKSEDCRRSAELNFNKEIQFNRYVDLYMDILNIDTQVITPPHYRCRRRRNRHLDYRLSRFNADLAERSAA